MVNELVPCIFKDNQKLRQCLKVIYGKTRMFPFLLNASSCPGLASYVDINQENSLS